MASQAQVRVGARVLVKEKNVRGTIRFIGQTMFQAGKWIGVELDDAVGKNNGTVAGRVYFLCDPNRGIFVRQNQVDILTGYDTYDRAPLPPKELYIPDKSPPPASPHPTVTPLKERSKSMLVTPKSFIPGRTAPLSPISSPRAKRRLIPKISSQRPGETSTKLKSSLEESASTEQYVPSPVLPGDEDIPEPWRSVIRDLSSKVDTLKVKRQDDRMKIKEGEKNKLQVQQQMEQKSHLLELQGRMQTELKNAQKELRSSHEQRSALQRRLQEVGEMMELATVDKELAEERAEAVQAELSVSKDKVEELSLDLEILQEEIRQSGPGVAATSVGLKQMEQQNNRLKEALVKVRDLLTTEQQGHREVMKELDKEKQTVETLGREKEEFKNQLEGCEETIDLLKEQVDLNISSERMIEVLSDRNLELEEKLSITQESLDDMEALKEIHDELEENQLAMERELREDLDIEVNKKHQVESRLEQAQLTIADYQDTVEKFRNLVASLQKDLNETRKEHESERNTREQLVSQSQAMLSLNLSLKASVTKGHSKAVDLELQKLDAIQAKMQVELLLQFLPASFYSEGGEYECVSLRILLLRLQFKVRLMLDQLRQQYHLEKYVDERAPVSMQNSEQLVYVSKLSLHLSKFSSLVGRLCRLLECCGEEKLAVLGGKVHEISVHERCVDGLLDLYKQDQLDSAVQFDSLNRAIAHLQLLTADTPELPNDSHCHLSDVLSHVRQVEEVNIVHLCCLKGCVLPEGEFASMLKGLDSLSVDFMIYCAKLARKVPVDIKANQKFFVSEEVIDKLVHYLDVCYLSHRALESGLAAIQSESLSLGETDKLNDIIANSTFNKAIADVFGTSGSNSNVTSCYKDGIKLFKEILEALQAGTFDKPSPGERPENSLTKRAAHVKGYLSDAEGLGERLEAKEREVLELKKSNAVKAQDIRNANVKIDMLENKFDSLKKESSTSLNSKAENILVLEHELLETKENHDQTIKTLESDIQNYEIENRQLQRSVEAAKRSSIPDVYPSPIHHEIIRRTGSQQLVDEESNMLVMHHNKVLKTALNEVISENTCLKRRLMAEQLRELKPLIIGGNSRIDDETNQSDSEKSLYKQYSRVKSEICHLEASPQVVDLTGGSRGVQEFCKAQVDNSIKRTQLARECEDLKQKIALLAASKHRGALIETEASSFVDPSYAKCRKIGAIHVPSTKGISRNITTNVDSEILRKLLFVTC